MMIKVKSMKFFGFIILSAFMVTIFYVTYMPYSNAEEFTISIPFGAYNPELNTPAEVWYDPPTITVMVGDTVTWINNDKEGHTVTSGESSGRFGWMGKDFGAPDGLFDSDRFLPNESWSYKFEESGTFSYFCTIHPWMEGVITVKESQIDYPHDALGNKIESFPVIKFTPDNIIEADLTWDPSIIKTHEKVQIKPAQRLDLYYGLYPILVLVPGVLFIIALFWMKKSKKIQQSTTNSPI